MCPTHGGSAPQVIFKAAVNLEEERQRLLVGLPDAVRTMIALMGANDESVRLRAAQIVQERFWGKAQDKLKLSGDTDEPLEIVISRRSAEPKQDEANHTDVPQG